LIIEGKGGDADDDLWADVLKRTRDAIQRALKAGYVVQDFGPYALGDYRDAQLLATAV
jgi:hypothetical protein